MELTNREIDILHSLASDTFRFFKPLDLGGRNGSHHSRTLLKLTKKELVERSKNYGMSWQSGKGTKQSGRGACVYRITEAGKKVWASLTQEQKRVALRDPKVNY